MKVAARKTRTKCYQTSEEVAPLSETPTYKQKQTDLEGTIKTNYLMTEKPVPDDESIDLLREWLNAPDALENPKFKIKKPNAEMCRLKYMPMPLKQKLRNLVYNYGIRLISESLRITYENINEVTHDIRPELSYKVHLSKKLKPKTDLKTVDILNYSWDSALRNQTDKSWLSNINEPKMPKHPLNVQKIQNKRKNRVETPDESVNQGNLHKKVLIMNQEESNEQFAEQNTSWNPPQVHISWIPVPNPSSTPVNSDRSKNVVHTSTPQTQEGTNIVNNNISHNYNISRDLHSISGLDMHRDDSLYVHQDPEASFDGQKTYTAQNKH